MQNVHRMLFRIFLKICSFYGKSKKVTVDIVPVIIQGSLNDNQFLHGWLFTQVTGVSVMSFIKCLTVKQWHIMPFIYVSDGNGIIARVLH